MKIFTNDSYLGFASKEPGVSEKMNHAWPCGSWGTGGWEALCYSLCLRIF